MTVREAARKFGCTHSSILRACAAGKIPGAKKISHKDWDQFRWWIPDKTIYEPRRGAYPSMRPSEETLDKCMQVIHTVLANAPTQRTRGLWERLMDGYAGDVTMSTRGNKA